MRHRRFVKTVINNFALDKKAYCKTGEYSGAAQAAGGRFKEKACSLGCGGKLFCDIFGDKNIGDAGEEPGGDPGGRIAEAGHWVADG